MLIANMIKHCGNYVTTGWNYTVTCTKCTSKEGNVYACDGSCALKYVNSIKGNTCTGNKTTSACTNCENGKITTNIKCEHDKSETHYYCEHGTDYTTEYHT